MRQAGGQLVPGPADEGKFPFGKASGQLQLVVIDMLAEVREPRQEHWPLPGSDRCDGGSDPGVRDHHLGLLHDLDQSAPLQVLHPSHSASSLAGWCRTVLDHEFLFPRQQGQQLERPIEGLMVGTEGDEDQMIAPA